MKKGMGRMGKKVGSNFNCYWKEKMMREKWEETKKVNLLNWKNIWYAGIEPIVNWIDIQV